MLHLKQAPFSAVRVVSTLPSKTFLVINILVESFTTWKIPVSTADPDCLPKKMLYNILQAFLILHFYLKPNSLPEK